MMNRKQTVLLEQLIDALICYQHSEDSDEDGTQQAYYQAFIALKKASNSRLNTPSDMLCFIAESLFKKIILSESIQSRENIKTYLLETEFSQKPQSVWESTCSHFSVNNPSSTGRVRSVSVCLGRNTQTNTVNNISLDEPEEDDLATGIRTT